VLHAVPIILHAVTLTIFGVQCKWWTSSLHNFLHLWLLHLSWIQIFSSVHCSVLFPYGKTPSFAPTQNNLLITATVDVLQGHSVRPCALNNLPYPAQEVTKASTRWQTKPSTRNGLHARKQRMATKLNKCRYFDHRCTSSCSKATKHVSYGQRDVQAPFWSSVSPCNNTQSVCVRHIDVQLYPDDVFEHETKTAQCS
jgi:hypothetical protein